VELLSVIYGQEAEMYTAATEFLREERNEVWSQEFDEVVGGTDRLASALARRLKSQPKMGCEVVRLEQDSLRGKAAAIYREDGRERRAEGDFLLCTLPFPVLARLRIEPAFSTGKQRAIRQLNYDASTKVLAIAKRRFWEADDGIYGGGTFTDLPSGTTYYPSDNAAARDPRVTASPSPFLASYTWGQAARRLGTLAHAERARLVLDHLSRVHPQLTEKDLVQRTASWSWDNHRWSGGAFAWFLPGQHTALHADIVKPEGRIHFAGEHASLTHTWMQGAFESAVGAVNAMLAVPGTRR
jgi:monoamine oxidase